MSAAPTRTLSCSCGCAVLTKVQVPWVGPATFRVACTSPPSTFAALPSVSHGQAAAALEGGGEEDGFFVGYFCAQSETARNIAENNSLRSMAKLFPSLAAAG